MRIIKIKISVITEETDNVIAKFAEMGIKKDYQDDLIIINSWIDLDKITRVDDSIEDNKFVINFIDGTYVISETNPFESLEVKCN